MGCSVIQSGEVWIWGQVNQFLRILYKCFDFLFLILQLMKDLLFMGPLQIKSSDLFFVEKAFTQNQYFRSVFTSIADDFCVKL